MTTNNPQVPWTDEQWARVNQVIHEEANRARVAATFLPLIGPLPGETDFVREERVLPDSRRLDPPLRIEDREIIQLATPYVMVPVRGAQMADPEMRSVLALFRRAANVVARLEDAVVFRGLIKNTAPPPPDWMPRPDLHRAPPLIWNIHAQNEAPGLWEEPPHPLTYPRDWQWIPLWHDTGQDLVEVVSNAIGQLEHYGHFGPFALVLGQKLFLLAQTPDQYYVLPQDRIIPFLGGGSLLRSSTLEDWNGVLVALGGCPIELIVATDLSVQFLQVTDDPKYLFRVRERIALRIKEADAIVRIFYVPTSP